MKCKSLSGLKKLFLLERKPDSDRLIPKAEKTCEITEAKIPPLPSGVSSLFPLLHRWKIVIGLRTGSTSPFFLAERSSYGERKENVARCERIPKKQGSSLYFGLAARVGHVCGLHHGTVDRLYALRRQSRWEFCQLG